MMKYEFRVGDYVETVEGKKGYLSKCQVFNGYIVFYVQYKNEKIYPCEVREDGLRYRFVRIGQYDFTKKDEGKIEFIDGVDITDPIDSPFIIDKINELVEAVNRLEEKVNNQT